VLDRDPLCGSVSRGGVATEALDTERRRAWNDARALARTEAKWGRGRPGTNTAPRPGHERARRLKGARYALWKNPEDLTERQNAKLAWIAKTDTRLYRAYLLKEGLRHVFSVRGEEGKQALDRWISWARRCRIPVFVELAGRIVRHREAIDAALDHGLSQGLIESTNTKIRLLTRIRVRIPLPGSAHRPGHARPRRPPPSTARPKQAPTDQSVGPHFGRINDDSSEPPIPGQTATASPPALPLAPLVLLAGLAAEAAQNTKDRSDSPLADGEDAWSAAERVVLERVACEVDWKVDLGAA
jgi:hypothetical protein